MSETLRARTAEEAREQLDETDDDCPWCGKPQYQEPEMRVCIHCPWNVMYPSDRSEAAEVFPFIDADGDSSE